MKMHVGGLALASVATVALASAAQAQTTLRLNHNNPEDHPLHISMERMGERFSELTGGAYEIRVYPNGQLGSQRESMEMVQNCALEMARSNTSELEAFEPLYSVLNLPFIYESEEHFYNVVDGEVGQEVLEASRDNGFIGIAFLTEGARSFYGDRAVTAPADLEGAQVRVQPSPSAIRMVELLGGSPTPIDWGELYSALQQGVVDMAENNPTALTTARHGEVADYFSLTEHTIIPSVVVMSACAWDAMSEEEQAALRQAASEAQQFHREAWEQASNAAIETAREEMGVEIVEVDKGPFAEAVAPMHEDLAAQSAEHAALLERIRGATN